MPRRKIKPGRSIGSIKELGVAILHSMTREDLKLGGWLASQKNHEWI